MTGLDPTVLQLFAEKQQPLDAGQFIVQVAAALEREERRRLWRRCVGLGAILAGIGFTVPWTLRALALLERELTLHAQALDFGPQWLELTLLCLTTFGLGTVWRLLRSVR